MFHNKHKVSINQLWGVDINLHFNIGAVYFMAIHFGKLLFLQHVSMSSAQEKANWFHTKTVKNLPLYMHHIISCYLSSFTILIIFPNKV